MRSCAIVYLLSSILGTYTNYKFVKIFYLLVDIPILNLALNIGFMLGIVLSYDKSIKRALAMNVISITTLTMIEIMTALTTDYVLKVDPIVSKVDYHSILGVILTNVTSFVIVLAISKFSKIKQEAKIPFHYWIALIIIPLITFYLLYTILQKSVISNTYLAIITTLMLIINFMIFALYDAICDYFEKRESEIIARQLNYSYEKQLELMKTSLEKTSSFQHDITKHINLLRTLINASENSKAIDYLNKINDDVFGNHIIVNSGNLVIDSIINHELRALEKENVTLTLMDEQIPDNLKISDYDINVLISNIVLNAVEAVRLLNDNKRIKLSLEYDKNILMLSVINTFDGIVNISNNKFITKKNSRSLHGIGLSNVKAIVNKYDGEIDIEINENTFSTVLMVYV